MALPACRLNAKAAWAPSPRLRGLARGVLPRLYIRGTGPMRTAAAHAGSGQGGVAPNGALRDAEAVTAMQGWGPLRPAFARAYPCTPVNNSFVDD